LAHHGLKLFKTRDGYRRNKASDSVAGWRFGLAATAAQNAASSGSAGLALCAQGKGAEAALYGQTLAAFSAACVDNGAAAFGFHANQKAVRAGAASFRWLVSAFHSHGRNPRSAKG
jgi:hypothetical protein